MKHIIRGMASIMALAMMVMAAITGCGGEAAEPPAEEPYSTSPASVEALPEPESAPESQSQSAGQSEAEALVFAVSSPAVAGGVLADEYGARGTQQENGVPTLSPPLRFEGAPEDTVSYALIMDDPDSVPVVGYVCDHWLICNIMGDALAEDASRASMALSSYENSQGLNCYGATGYGGPKPPDAPHTYVFRAYALDAELELAGGYTRAALEAAMEGHILAEATLEAEYSN